MKIKIHDRVRPKAGGAPTGIVLAITNPNGGLVVARLYVGADGGKPIHANIPVKDLVVVKDPATGPHPLQMLPEE